MTSTCARGASAARGVSLIELLVGIAVLSVALMLGVPSLSEWIANTQIRSTAESLQNGLNLARAEAVRRNTIVRFQLTTTLDNSCALARTGASWVVNMSQSVAPAQLCGASVSDENTPFLLQKSGPVTSRTSATVDASQSTVAFNGLGRMTSTTNPTTAASITTFGVGSSSGTCVKDAGKMRCLQVTVTPAGQIRMCDPARSATATPPDPMAC
jgi:type IV fimbrial biogenesis protein FimT